MNNKIRENIDHFEQLETLYRADKQGFETAFFEIYPEIADKEIAGFWKARLEFDQTKDLPNKIRRSDILFLVIACAVTAFLIKTPQLFGINVNEYFFYEKNTGMIVLFGLSLYAFLTKDTIQSKPLLIALLVFVVSALYINFLPSDRDSHSINLSYIHLPLMLWCLYGLIFIDFDLTDAGKRIDYIKYNGDLAILGAIILISGGILTGVTVGLFSAIDLEIKDFYFEYIVVCGLVSAPIVATFIIRKYPFVANKIAPIIATIFSPLVLITLIVYLASIVVTGKDPYNDRDFLIVFNVMLLGVMGIVVFSISEASSNKKQRFNELTLFALSIVTLIIDLVALSAILYRLGEYGFTPNRTAVLGSNLLIFGNLLLIMLDLYRVNFKNKDVQQVEWTIAKYLPIYTLWTIFVVFVLPWIFGLK
jgi:hypothetical protein